MSTKNINTMEDLIDDSTSYDAVEEVAADDADYALQQGIEEHEQYSRNLVTKTERSTATVETSGAAVSQTGLELEADSIRDSLEDWETVEDRQGSGHGLENDMLISSPPQRLRAIEVVLRPPPDPESYERIPPSRLVLRVSEGSEIDDETIYEVEFRDGRLEYVSVK
ncbi:hypothetical protein GGR58DRAFT_26010 [Xylaria digitata]|nr:hypothetical protein GGR58DRAFT_26010 [Xylaria digitata]